jgi:hypothetical protein
MVGWEECLSNVAMAMAAVAAVQKDCHGEGMNCTSTVVLRMSSQILVPVSCIIPCTTRARITDWASSVPCPINTFRATLECRYFELLGRR